MAGSDRSPSSGSREETADRAARDADRAPPTTDRGEPLFEDQRRADSPPRGRSSARAERPPHRPDAAPEVDADLSLPDGSDPSDPDADPEELIEAVDAAQEYVKITPVREEVNAETIKRQLHGLHRYGDGKKLPLDLEEHVAAIESVSSFEFIIYKPPDAHHFDFYLGPGEGGGDVSPDRLADQARSMYPENYEFEREEFDINRAFDDDPHMVRYEGLESRRKDWMTTLSTFETDEVARSPLATLLESAIQSDGAVLFQTVFEPRQNWSSKAERQKRLLQQGVHSQGGLFFRTLFEGFSGVSEEEKSQRHRGDTPHEIGGSAHDTVVTGERAGTSRMTQIDLKDPAHTFNVSVRVAASEERTARNLGDSLNHLGGRFYDIEGQFLGQNEGEYRRMLDHAITRPTGLESWTRRKPMFVMSVGALSVYTTVPSVDSLPKASRAGTGGAPASQSPLTALNEEVFTEFTDGMTVGRASTALRERAADGPAGTDIEGQADWWHQAEERDAISLSAEDLTHHYLRAATTGSGKTVATINDMLTAHENLDGPTVLVDQKDGDMCENYLRAHRTLFGDLDDVEYLTVPEEDGMIPGMPFFDVRPLVRGAGRERATAVQDIVDHYFEVLRFVLGASTVDQAFVANEILTNLIKALFDGEHGADQFAIGDLLSAAQRFQRYGCRVDDVEEDADLVEKAVPDVSDPQVESILRSHLEKESRQLMNTTDAVLNRIRKLKERDFIWDILSYTVPEEHWNEETGWYDRDAVPMLDLKSVLNSDTVLLLDTGQLRGESSEVFTVLFLSQLWTAAQSIWTPTGEDYIANVIVEESANIARNKIVYRDLLPKGREFNISLGLIMQYPEQVLGDDPSSNRRAYREILNNINTKIIGNIATDDALAESLFHEDLDTDEIKDRIAGLRRGEWVVQLPATGFNEQKPELLTLRPLPIPPGHDAGPFETSSRAEHVRARSRGAHCVSSDHPAVRVGAGVGDAAAPDAGAAADTDADAELTHDHYSFLGLVFDSLTDGVTGYDLSRPMTDLPLSAVAPDLVEWGYLEKTYLGNNEIYYEPTERAMSELDRDLSPRGGGERGGESLVHRIGVKLTEAYYDRRGYDTELYHTPEMHSVTYDLVAWPTTDSPGGEAKFVEVETTPEHAGHVKGDYRTLSSSMGDAVWVTENLDGAKRLLASLEDYVDTPPKAVRNFDDLNAYLDDPGAARLFSINTLRDEL